MIFAPIRWWLGGKQELLSILVDGHRGWIGPGVQQMYKYIYIYIILVILQWDMTHMLSTDHYDADAGIIVASSDRNIFRVTGPLWGESTGTGGFPSQRPVTRSFAVFFDLHLNKRLS